MKKINYLFETKSNFNLIVSYLLYSIKLKIIKKDRKKFIKNYQNFLKKKKITCDFFSRNVFDWFGILNKLKNKKFDYLEIGSFEGNSALFILEYFKNSNLVCVDQWKQLYESDGTKEGYEKFSIDLIEKNFDNNLKDYVGRFTKNKISSDLFFNENDKQFDIIFVDGSHYADDVANDCINSWLVLKKNGILILDDFFWKGYDDLKDNPAYAINKFLKKIKNDYKIISLTKFQLHLKKIN
jgi:predicted O-methyltransferase YrrM